MAWSTLGSLSPNLLDWQTLSAPAEGELFRFSQSWVGEWPGTGYIRIRLFYANDEFYEDGYFEATRLYATRDEQLMIFPFSLILGQAGYNVRYFQARLNLRARPYAIANWQLNVDQFIGETGTLDGGEYV